MLPHLSIVALAAVIPLAIGLLWYNPKIFGTAWMKASFLSEEKMKGVNLPIVFSLTYLFAFMMSLVLFSIVVHQTGLYSLFADEPGFREPGTAANLELQGLMETLGHKFRTFKHGAFHGAITAIFIVLPVIGTNALLESKGGKYILINVAYWLVSLALMGGVLCQWG